MRLCCGKKSKKNIFEIPYECINKTSFESEHAHLMLDQDQKSHLNSTLQRDITLKHISIQMMLLIINFPTLATMKHNNVQLMLTIIKFLTLFAIIFVIHMSCSYI